MESISVIVPTIRRYRPLLDTVKALLAQDYADFEVVVADQNLSWPEEFHEELEALQADPRVRWLFFDKPGVVYARNKAVHESRGDLLVFVDDDVYIPYPTFLNAHAACYADASVQAVAAREITLPGGRDLASFLPELERLTAPSDKPPVTFDWSDMPPIRQVLHFNREQARDGIVATFCTCNASIRRSAFLAVGGFDENFAGNSYGDDYDIALRLHAAGKKIIFASRPWLVHLKAPIGGLRVGDPANRFGERERALSRWLFFLRHSAPGFRRSMLREVLRRTVFTKANILSPVRHIKAWNGLIHAWVDAREAVRRGPVSLFTQPSRNRGLRQTEDPREAFARARETAAAGKR